MSLLANLPPVIQPQSFQELVPEPVRPAQEERKGIIIVHSKDVPSEERKVFEFWGRVAVWDARYVNIPLDKLPVFDYLFVDVRVKEARNALGAMDLSAYRTVCYVPWYHKSESFVDQLEAIALTSFPLRAISKEDFERQLLSADKLHAPSIARSFLSMFLPCLSA